MKSPDTMRQLFDSAAVGTNAAPDEAVFETIKTVYTRTRETRSAPREPATWRCFVERPRVGLTIAAAVVLLAILAVPLWQGTGGGIVLADVLDRIQQARACRYQVDVSTIESDELPSGRREWRKETQMTILISQDLGKKTTIRKTDPATGRSTLREVYILPRQRTVLEVMPVEKKYSRTELNETRLQELQEEVNSDPGDILREVLDCDYATLGRSTVDGITVEGFQTTDLKFLQGTPGTVDVKIWVDVRTSLPVREESNLVFDLADGFKASMRSVAHGFQWDIPIDAAEFNPILPDDYADLMGGTVKMPAVNEENAIEGLRQFAALSGRYPTKLEDPTFNNELLRVVMDSLMRMSSAPAPGQSRQEWAQQQNRKQREIMYPIIVTRDFNTLLVRDGKAPVYHGDVVMPQDVDKVLMQWKIADTEYRVVFGSLHVETVNGATLAELEKILPK